MCRASWIFKFFEISKNWWFDLWNGLGKGSGDGEVDFGGVGGDGEAVGAIIVAADEVVVGDVVVDDDGAHHFLDSWEVLVQFVGLEQRIHTFFHVVAAGVHFLVNVDEIGAMVA